MYSYNDLISGLTSPPMHSLKHKNDAPKIECKYCNKTFAINSIVQHAVKSKCKSRYSEDEVSILRTSSKEYGDVQKKIKHDFKKNMLPIVCSFSAVSKLLFDRENLHKIGSLHPPQEA